MQYQIQGQPYPVAVLTLQPEESVLCQKGAMSWMTPNMEMATKGGGLGKMFSRALTSPAKPCSRTSTPPKAAPA